MVLISVKKMGVGLTALILGTVLPACGGGSSPDSNLPSVFVTTTVLGDLVSAVAGDQATVTILLPIGADPHDFAPSSRQLAAAADADLIVLNGLGLEEQLESSLRAAASPTATVLAIAVAVDPIPFGHDDHADDHGDLDPHVWLDPVRMSEAADLVAAALEGIAPGRGWAERAASYRDRLAGADTEVERLLGQIPPERRLLVTNHESLGYFAARYGFEVVGVVIPGGSTLAEPSSAELADLVAVIRAAGIPAIFAETTSPTGLADAIAAELGDGVAVVDLYTESLGEPGSGAGTLPDMLVENARRIAAALGG